MSTSKIRVALAITLIIITALPTVLAQPLTYTRWVSVPGVLESDRSDYMNADGNPLKEDIANYLFTGYMRSLYLDVTNYGTISKANYTRSTTTPYRWLPLIEETPAPSFGNAPVEGWALAYNMTLYPKDLAPDTGYLAVTLSGWDGSKWSPNIIGKEADDNWVFVNVVREVLVDNPRLWVGAFNITVRNDGSPYKPIFNVEIRIVFNKATKFVKIYQRAKLAGTSLPEGCYAVQMEMSLSRMAILDANPYCDRAFYGWKNVAIPDSDAQFFMVLSWTNSTLAKWVRPGLGYDYYATYMIAYPIPDSWAIASTWYGGPRAASVWSSWMLKWTGYSKYVYLNMGDIDGDNRGDGDQALIRVEWYSNTDGIVLPEELELGIDWKLVMYGVYDVDGSDYDGGEGGVFNSGELTLSNGDTHVGPVTEWTHTGTLGWLNSLNNITSGSLCKSITRLDTNQNGAIGVGETNIPRCWYPEDELLNQLSYSFAPPKLSEAREFAQLADFIAIPAPGATPDAAGAAMFARLLTMGFVLFDVEAYNLSATIGYVNPGTKMLPYLMLRLKPIPPTVEDYPARRSHYLTGDGRAFIQMEGIQSSRYVGTWYSRYVVSIAGYHPNLVTYYFTDFTPIFRIIGGPYSGDFVVLPTGPVIKHIPYTGVGARKGLGVIAVARDHFNNIALLVYGLDAQDTYWTAYVATYGYQWILDNYGNAQAILLEIDYSGTGAVWGDGRGIPIAHPSYPSISVIAASTEYEVKPLKS